MLCIVNFPNESQSDAVPGPQEAEEPCMLLEGAWGHHPGHACARHAYPADQAALVEHGEDQVSAQTAVVVHGSRHQVLHRTQAFARHHAWVPAPSHHLAASDHPTLEDQVGVAEHAKPHLAAPAEAEGSCSLP